MSFVQFWGPLVPQLCSGPALGYEENMCTLCDLMSMIDNIIKFLATLAPIITLLIIVWGTFLIITSGGSIERVKKGRKIITTAITGLVIVLTAWIIVSTTFLLLTGNYQGSLPLPWYQVTC